MEGKCAAAVVTERIAWTGRIYVNSEKRVINGVNTSHRKPLDVRHHAEAYRNPRKADLDVQGCQIRVFMPRAPNVALLDVD